MLLIKNITLKNFMSVGAVTQAVTFDQDQLTLVLGNNIDLGSDGSRNGTGKTTLVNAISYALFGTAITNIRRDNLINKTNGKNMVVSLTFTTDNHEYKIERGRRPNKFKFYVDDQANEDESLDEAQGEIRHTQKIIEDIIKMSSMMFNHIIALNTYTEPFLNMKANDQREFIEELLGITELSKKAEILKENIKENKESIVEENYKIKSIQDANQKIQTQIEKATSRSETWKEEHTTTVNRYKDALAKLAKIQIEDEIKLHKDLELYNQQITDLRRYGREMALLQRNENNDLSTIDTVSENLKTAKNHTCFTCGQEIHDKAHEKIIINLTKQLEDTEINLKETTGQISKLETKIDKIGEPDIKPETFYNTKGDAYDHQDSVSRLADDLKKELKNKNPYLEQIDELTSGGLQLVSYDTTEQLEDLKNHQEFLLKLLINKDSFIRKGIIDQNLSYLNNRLDYYLTKIGLPHEVKFLSDLTVEITELGRELDFDNLSRGERNRLILSLSWAFRDVFENLNEPINLMFIDELIDNGTDTAGVEAALSVLKKITRERNKNIFLISHREELIGRVSTVLNVIKENGFTSFIKEDE